MEIKKRNYNPENLKKGQAVLKGIYQEAKILYNDEKNELTWRQCISEISKKRKTNKIVIDIPKNEENNKVPENISNESI